MKKILTLVAVAGMFTFYACGPSAEEIAAKEKMVQDSIAAVQAAQAEAEAARAKATADSLAAVEAAAAAEKAMADSIAAATAAAKGGSKSNKPKVVIPKTVVSPGGRGGATKQ